MTSNTTSTAAETLCDLIRIDTTNDGTDDGPGERLAAEYAATRLSNAGLEPLLLESAPRRANLITRWPGVDRSRPPLLVHGHLDVVPAQASDWSVDPFAGFVKDGFVWGRGAIDMKQFIAQLLVLVEERQSAGRLPARDVVLVFTADEEHSGQRGAYWLAREHRDQFDGIVDAMGEGGGFNISLANGQRCYPVGTSEKGMLWTRVIAEGRAGHGSSINRENAVTRLSAAMARVGAYEFPVQLTPTVEASLAIVAEAAGLPASMVQSDPEAICDTLPLIADDLKASLRHMANPTMLSAGYKTNVIPGHAEGVIDARTLPGFEAEFLAKLDELLGPHVTREAIVHDVAHEGPASGRVWDAIVSAIADEDPSSVVAPSIDNGGTDAKAFVPLGITCYGFTPVQFPADEPHPELYHGIDERVPIDGLDFGVRVLDRLFDLV